MVLQGRLCADPDLRNTQAGTPVCSFRVAWSEKYNESEKKLFLACTAWRGTGEMVSKYFSKGQEIAVEGKLSTRDWTDQEGNKRQRIEMTVDRVHFCGPKQSDMGNAPERSLPNYQGGAGGVNIDASDFTDDDGELPF